MKDKIRKLLALASNPGAAPNEAATASRQAAALMAKHDIDLADLEEEELRAQFDLTQGHAMGCRPGKKNPKDVPTWINVISYGVKLYTRTRCSTSRGFIIYRGPREDVELAQWLNDALVTQCYKDSKGRSMSDAAAFRMGYAAALQERLRNMVLDRVDADATAMSSSSMASTALVKVQGVREQVMNEAYGEECAPGSAKASQSMEGRLAGMSANIPMGRPVSHSALRLS